MRCSKGTRLWRQKKEMLRDIAILTGSQVITEELGLDLKKQLWISLDAAKVVVQKYYYSRRSRRSTGY